VQVDQVTRVDIVLEVGSLSDSVQVEGAAPLLESDKSTISSVVDTRTIASMPLNARQYLDSLFLRPAPFLHNRQQGGGFNMAGARSQSNLFSARWCQQHGYPDRLGARNFRITDAVQEFAVQSSVPTAEFGRGHGAQVSIVTKAHNKLPRLRPSSICATPTLMRLTFSRTKLGGTKNTLHRNQYGAAFGGPIRHDKTFFFASWEGFRQVNPTVSSTRVPTDTERAQVTDPISKNLLQFWPTANATPAGSTINFIANVGASTFDNTGLIKIDHNFSERDHLSAAGPNTREPPSQPVSCVAWRNLEYSYQPLRCF